MSGARATAYDSLVKAESGKYTPYCTRQHTSAHVSTCYGSLVKAESGKYTPYCTRQHTSAHVSTCYYLLLLRLAG